jgi:hypothetical protein
MCLLKRSYEAPTVSCRLLYLERVVADSGHVAGWEDGKDDGSGLTDPNDPEDPYNPIEGLD